LKKILIITGGLSKKLDPFIDANKKLNLSVFLASFSDLNYFSKEEKFSLIVKEKDVSEFDLIYIRMVGKRLEDVTLLVNYAKEKNIKVIDRLYENAISLPSSISKAMEMRSLIKEKLPLPTTYYASLDKIRKNANEKIGYPFVIKSTSGKKSRDVWIVENSDDLNEHTEKLLEREKEGHRFFAQKLIKASQRIRVLVIGGKAIGAITRPTKYRKRWTEKINGEYPEGEKKAISPIPSEIESLSMQAAKAADLDICGVDILKEDNTGKLFVIEANAAPSWKALAKDTGICVEEEILKYLSKL